MQQAFSETKARKLASHALILYCEVVLLVTFAAVSTYQLLDRFWPIRPLFDKADQFRDLTNYWEKTAHLRGNAVFLGWGPPTYNYPAPAAFVYKFFLHTFPGHGIRMYLIFLASSILILGSVALIALKHTPVRVTGSLAIFVTMFAGYPLWYTADRGNIEGVAWALASAGLCFLLASKFRSAAILIGLGACVKPFPIAFLLLLISMRKYKETVLGAATAALVILAALCALGPNPWQAYKALKPGVRRYISVYIDPLAPPNEARFDHSLLDTMKSAAVVIEMRGLHPVREVAEINKLRLQPGGYAPALRLANIYPYIAVTCLAGMFAVFYNKPLLNQMTAIAIAITALSPSSGEYTLLHLYVPFGAFVVFLARDVATGRTAIPKWSIKALAIIYGLLFAPLTILMIYAADAKFFLLACLLIVVAKVPLHSSFLLPGDTGQRKNSREPARVSLGQLAS